VSGGTQTTSDLAHFKSYSLNSSSGNQLSQCVRDRLNGSQSLPKPGKLNELGKCRHYPYRGTDCIFYSSRIQRIHGSVPSAPTATKTTQAFGWFSVGHCILQLLRHTKLLFVHQSIQLVASQQFPVHCLLTNKSQYR